MINVQGHRTSAVLEGNVLVLKDTLLRMLPVVFRVCFFTFVYFMTEYIQCYLNNCMYMNNNWNERVHAFSYLSIWTKRSEDACSGRNNIFFYYICILYFYVPDVMFILVPASNFIAGQKSILPQFQHKGNRPQSPRITIF